MKKVIFDTNALLRFILNDIPAQKKTVEILLQKSRQGQITILIPQIVIFEIDFILRKYYQFSKNEILSKLKALVSTSYLDVQSGDIFTEALKIYQTSSNSFVDCFLLAKSQIEGYELFTFDKKILRASL